MTADFLSGLVGVFLSLVFSYVPKLNEKFALLDETYKRLIMLGLLVVTSAAIYGLTCVGWSGDVGIQLTCDKAGLISLLRALAAAAIANQTAYALSPRAPAVRAAKAK